MGGCLSVVALYAMTYLRGVWVEYAQSPVRAWTLTLNVGWVDFGSFDNPWALMFATTSPFEPEAGPLELFPGWTVGLLPTGGRYTYSLVWNEKGSQVPDGVQWHFHYVLPLWPVAVPAGLGAVLALRRPAGRRRNGRCRACGYDRSGLPVGTVCPECGGR